MPGEDNGEGAGVGRERAFRRGEEEGRGLQHSSKEVSARPVGLS